jgi:hypothetical protein
MEFDRCHVNSRRVAVAGVVDPVAAYSEASLIGVVLLWVIVDAHASICDVFLSVDWDIVSSDEDYCVCACANARDALGTCPRVLCTWGA